MKKLMFILFLLLSISVSYAQLAFNDAVCPDNKNALRDTCGLPQTAYADSINFNESYKLLLHSLCSKE